MKLKVFAPLSENLTEVYKSKFWAPGAGERETSYYLSLSKISLLSSCFGRANFLEN
jgi:hypothetical protein